MTTEELSPSSFQMSGLSATPRRDAFSCPLVVQRMQRPLRESPAQAVTDTRRSQERSATRSRRLSRSGLSESKAHRIRIRCQGFALAVIYVLGLSRQDRLCEARHSRDGGSFPYRLSGRSIEA